MSQFSLKYYLIALDEPTYVRSETPMASCIILNWPPPVGPRGRCVGGWSDEGPLYGSLETTRHMFRPQLLQQHLDVLVLRCCDEKGFSTSGRCHLLYHQCVPRQEMNNRVAKTPFGLTISVDDLNV